MNSGQGCECVLCDPRFSYLLLWGPAGWSPLLGYLKQLLCTGPHLLWLPTKYVCACVILIKITQTSPKTNNTPPKEISHIVETGQDMEKGEKAEIFFFLPNEFGWTEQKWRGEMGEIAPKPSVKGWGGCLVQKLLVLGGSVAQLLPSVSVWNLKSPPVLFSLSGCVKLWTATHC